MNNLFPKLGDLAILAVMILVAALGGHIISKWMKMPALKNSVNDRITDQRSGSIQFVGLNAAEQIVRNGASLILDARPSAFYKAGHIPGAENLSRRDFENDFVNLESKVKDAMLSGMPILIYCTDTHCPDASAVAGMLRENGVNSILLFNAGWSAWRGAGLPVETSGEL